MADFIKKFTVQCNFKGKSLPFAIYIGNPKNNTHPVHYQDSWLIKERGCNIPSRVKESLQKLHKLSQENGISFPELCAYAITIVNSIKGRSNNKK
ncbi:MAG: DUF2610 domain-containing protein [Wolbachia endosymbiont of Meromenopon meropis]|nr:DUF2610 domain-containing protein [Wolbachia endosymbiont of Meromenopon meropis]